MTKERYSVLIAVVALLVLLCPVKSMAQNNPPIADAGLSRYTAEDPVVLDGTGSFDPDNSGILSYTWRQTSGPSVVITDANTANPMISGFVQTNEIQECEFELVVSDADLTSLPDTVKVIIVPAMIDYPDPDNKASSMEIATGVFDPEKPTLVFFGGGLCSYGGWYVLHPLHEWMDNVNFINFPWYEPDRPAAIYTYDGCANMLLTYLSSVAPDYKKPIQIRGHSTGAMPAIGVANYLNTTYGDARYAVNRVSLFDAGSASGCHDVRPEVAAFCANPVDGEQCWVDNYYSRDPRSPIKGALNVFFPHGIHRVPVYWYIVSLDEATWSTDIYNDGLTAGLYISVAGPAKNLELATNPGSIQHYFRWNGDYNPDTITFSSGYMDFYNESDYPGKLPEPVTLVGPVDVGDPNGAVLTCEESENAVGYQLLFGSDPDRVMDYYIISDTPNPPTEVITTFPFEQTWWTIKVRDQYGSTIYADPILINAQNVTQPVQKMIENVTIGEGYGSIQDAIDEAEPGDEIVIGAATYQYFEKINFKGKNLTVRSTDPNDPAVVAATVINGGNQGSVVTFSGSEDANCVLAGLTITGGKRGIYCSGASPTITNCTIAGNGNADMGAGMYLKDGSSPTLVNCTFSENSASMMGGGIYLESDSSPTLTNCTIINN